MTKTFAIDSLQRYPVVVMTTCRRVTIREERDSTGAPKCDLMMAQPVGSDLITMPKDMRTAGAECVFVASSGVPQVFIAGTVIGEIMTTKGACIVQQIESQ